MSYHIFLLLKFTILNASKVGPCKKTKAGLAGGFSEEETRRGFASPNGIIFNFIFLNSKSNNTSVLGRFGLRGSSPQQYSPSSNQLTHGLPLGLDVPQSMGLLFSGTVCYLSILKWLFSQIRNEQAVSPF